MTELASVVVIGAGAMGSSVAAELSRRGHAVTLVEQFDLLHARGSSHGSSRIVRLVYSDPFFVRLAALARPLWDELQATTDLDVFHQTGGVDHGPRERVEPLAAALTEAGVAYEWVSPDEAARRWPVLRFDESVLFQPDAGVAHADHTVDLLQQVARQHGATLLPHTRVEAIGMTAEGVTVTAGDRTLTADQVVVTAGVWTHRLADLPTEVATQVQPAHFTPNDAAQDWPTFIHHRAGPDGTPEAYGLPSPDGIKLGFHGRGRIVDPDDRDFAVVPEELEDLRAYATEWLPGVDPSTLDATTCLYGALAENDFIIDRAGPVTVAAGFSGHGFKFVPLVGLMVADLVAGTATAGPRFAFSAHQSKPKV
ncbi:MAG: FAD-dependent oxidoreductase [Aeromicrobium sp.]|nr:FAD-dependent oxidoreductase [Aeromicrobium sp.]